MIRMSRKVLRTTISVALAVRPKWQPRALGLANKVAMEETIDDLVDRIMGKPESETVILQPSMTGIQFGERVGKWGIDEPHPHPDLPMDRDT